MPKAKPEIPETRRPARPTVPVRAKSVPTGNLAAKFVGLVCQSEGVQDEPALIRFEGQVVAAIKVDSVALEGPRLHIEGWSVGDVTFSISADAELLPQVMRRLPRPDVAAVSRIAQPEGGFGFVAELPSRGLTPVLVIQVAAAYQGTRASFRFPVRLTSGQDTVPEFSAVGFTDVGFGISN